MAILTSLPAHSWHSCLCTTFSLHRMQRSTVWSPVVPECSQVARICPRGPPWPEALCLPAPLLVLAVSYPTAGCQEGRSRGCQTLWGSEWAEGHSPHVLLVKPSLGGQCRLSAGADVAGTRMLAAVAPWGPALRTGCRGSLRRREVQWDG